MNAWRKVAGAVLVLAAGPALAQSPCGDNVTVVYGDTLRELALRCDTTVEAMLRENQQIKDKDVIEVGMVLRVPEERAPRGTPQDPYTLAIAPDSGPPGSGVQITATGLPANADVLIGAGVQNSEYKIVDRARANATGRVDTMTMVPDQAGFGEEWVFVVTTVDEREKATSEVFTVRRPETQAEDQQAVTVTVRGTLTTEGTECQALRSLDGELYTLIGELQDFKPGDRVTVEGAPVATSYCMQGQTLRVGAVGALE